MPTEKYREVMALAAQFLQLDDAAKALKDETVPQERYEELNVNDDIQRLLIALNLAVNEVAQDYLPLIKTETVSSVDGRIYFRNLQKEIIDVFCLKKNKTVVPFRTLHDCVFSSVCGKLEITYSYAPFKGTLETQLPWEEETLGARTLAYGAACEYCLLSGMTEDAALFDKRFKDSLQKRKRPKNNVVMRRRSWL